MGYPAKVPAYIEGKVPGKRRAHVDAKGTRQYPLPKVGTPGPHRNKHWSALLFENAKPYRQRRAKRA